MPTSGFSDILEQVDFLYEGQIAHTEELIIRTGFNKDTVPIVHGRAVCQHSSENGLILPADGNSIILGIAIETQVRERVPGATVGAYPVDSQVAYLVRGVIGVLVDMTVTEGAPAFVRHTAGAGFSVKGSFRINADTSNAVALAGSRFLKGGVAGSILPLSINLA